MARGFAGAKHNVKVQKSNATKKEKKGKSEPVYTGITNPDPRTLTRISRIILTVKSVTLFCDFSFLIEAKITEWICFINHSHQKTRKSKDCPK